MDGYCPLQKICMVHSIQDFYCPPSLLLSLKMCICIQQPRNNKYWNMLSAQRENQSQTVLSLPVREIWPLSPLLLYSVALTDKGNGTVAILMAPIYHFLMSFLEV